jgi:integrase
VKLKDGGKARYYVLRWKRSDGKMQTESIGRVGAVTAEQAKAARDAKAIAFGTGDENRDAVRGMTLARFLELDREALKAKARATVRVHEIASAHAINALGADFVAEKLTTDHADRIHNHLLAAHEINGRKVKACSKATARKIIVTLKAAWNRGIERKRLPNRSNPFRGVEVAAPASKAKRIYTAAEFAAMVEVAPDAWWKAFIRLGYTTGLRLGEMLNLTWDDVDGESVRVVNRKASKVTVGERSLPLLAWTSKTEPSLRTVPMPKETADAVQRLRLTSAGSPYLFLTVADLQRLGSRQDAGKLPDPAAWVNNVRRDFHVIQRKARALMAERAGVDVSKVAWPVGSAHDLRKSYGVTVARAGVPVKDLQTLMGHSNVTTTLDFYNEPDADIAAKVSKVFAAAG